MSASKNRQTAASQPGQATAYYLQAIVRDIGRHSLSGKGGARR